MNGLFSKINIGSIIGGISKTINVANKALPLIDEAKPLIENAKKYISKFTMKKNISNISNSTNKLKKENNLGITFFQ